MEASEIVVGLDIGTTKIVCIVGRRNEYGKIEILGMGRSESVGVTRGVVSNIEKTVQSIKTAVTEAENQSGVDIRTVNVGIAGQHIKSLQHRGIKMRNSLEEEISQKDIDALIDDMYKLVMLPGEEIIHVLPQEYIVDSEVGIKDPIGMSGVRLEANFHIITGQVAAVKNIHKCIQKAGLEVVELILEPLASSEAVLNDEEKEAGVVLVDIGGGTTDIAIFQEGIIRHTAVIPFGGNVITEDIKEGCTIIKSQAELLKMKFGSALASENKENEIVINAIEAHHGDVEPTSEYAVLTIIADSVSAGRAGSRKNAYENYVERVSSLENIATKYDGVQSAFALQGGREVRVIVQNDQISDELMPKLANDIKREIESTITFPGTINVNIIRESRFNVEASKENVMEYND